MKSIELAFVLGFVLSACELSRPSPGAAVGGSCPAFTPCGGNIVGMWRLKSMCLKSTPTDAAVACTVQSMGSPTMGPAFYGTYTFTANGTFAESIGGSETWTLSYPGVACSRSDASAAQYCTDIQQRTQSAYAAAADAGTITPITSVGFTCTASGSEFCKCDESLTYSPCTIEGTYTTNGDLLTATTTGSSILLNGGSGDGGTGSPTLYCVSGNTLTLGPSPGSSVEGVIILTK
jgi:hypothetical protein